MINMYLQVSELLIIVKRNILHISYFLEEGEGEKNPPESKNIKKIQEKVLDCEKLYIFMILGCTLKGSQTKTIFDSFFIYFGYQRHKLLYIMKF